ncbi:helix-turn-helix domain-containing protein [Candidatus Kaiserbacteria bacterium]|nr:helix-turn-helix domain-containing protein [Candidatus Kaiserbacteria bacterium]
MAKTKGRNGVRHTIETKTEAILMRKIGRTHREIAAALNISLATAWLWLKDIQITPSQKLAIESRRHTRKLDKHEKTAIANRLKPFQYKDQYSDEDLLDKIKKFYKNYGRIPLKHEFNSSRIYRLRFGSWNNAVKMAGFETNPVLFAKRFVAQDGHICDSFSDAR